MNPSKYEGSILEDDIVEEPFKIEVGTNMKTLEQLVIDTIAQNLQSYKVNTHTAAKIASEIREWIKEQNVVLRETIYNVLVDELPADQNSLNDCREYADKIISVIPPRGPIDPNTLQTEMEKWQASRIQELETTLSAVRVELDKLRPIRSAQESRIQQTKTHISNGIKTGNGHYIDQADSVLSEFLDEMQKAKAIHAEIDSIIEKVQISQMEEQRKEFDSGGISPAEADDLNAIRQKAHAYTALREKFPFLPGEYFYALFNDRIRRFECENILVGGAYLLGKDRGGTTINFRPDQCYATLQELKDKLEVVE